MHRESILGLLYNWSTHLEDVGYFGRTLRSALSASVNLSNANLSFANMFGAYLSGVKLSGANLSNDELSFANLACTQLQHANLSHATLSCADLSYADLSYADLSGSIVISPQDISGSKFYRANMHNLLTNMPHFVQHITVQKAKGTPLLVQDYQQLRRELELRKISPGKINLLLFRAY
jgi:uncharacterized protein YjbI with pentapeptide repeats